mgnify:CR=1 FL=1
MESKGGSQLIGFYETTLAEIVKSIQHEQKPLKSQLKDPGFLSLIA